MVLGAVVREPSDQQDIARLMRCRYEYTGQTEQESLGAAWRIALHPDDAKEADKLWAHSLKTGQPYSAEHRCRKRDGEYRWMLARALPITNIQTGAIEKWFGTFTDIQEPIETRSAAKRLVKPAFLILKRT